MQAHLTQKEPSLPNFSIKPIFAWYDMWVGAFWDSAKRRLYIFPIPMFGIIIQFGSKP